MHLHYPKWKFHPELDAQVVADPAAEDALGDGWHDTPATFPDDSENPEIPEAEPEVKKSRKAAK